MLVKVIFFEVVASEAYYYKNYLLPLLQELLFL
jgi:hypothetical protein